MMPDEPVVDHEEKQEKEVEHPRFPVNVEQEGRD
ncbi:hypothetical protein EDC14_1001145 [Hydrogenispora ethanolica]|uniref:Uncharacterized protein n=1 Tax=Hydrogenispora ethanolica TaxID=1082276 RepID=A0A4R1SDX3_HYDET|nr:hypothetical protein EDC14_1001145 [Hydrogenispora ethanolica]